MASVAVELRNVTFSFNKVGSFRTSGSFVSHDEEALLRNVSLQISHGEAFAIIGPSGQGKSVLMKVMAGLLEPSRGEVFIDGQSLLTTRGRKREALIRRMGMLFQKNALFDSLTVAENVAFPLREVAKASETEIQDAIHFYLDAVGILHAKDLYPDEISGGMQKRLGIARALALKPEILFYDDPTAGLDPITSRKIIQLIIDLRKERGSTVIAVTNDMNRAYQLEGRIAMVVQGEVLVTGDKEGTVSHPDPRVRQFINGLLNGPLTVTA